MINENLHNSRLSKHVRRDVARTQQERKWELHYVDEKATCSGTEQQLFIFIGCFN
jgi:hypothetical protein